jgi:hypothetical protein
MDTPSFDFRRLAGTSGETFLAFAIDRLAGELIPKDMDMASSTS